MYNLYGMNFEYYNQELGLSRLRWKYRQKVLKIMEKSAQIVLNFRKKCFKFRNSARKFARR